MPIPKKPGELRATIARAIVQTYAERSDYIAGGLADPYVDAAMRALAEYDLPYFKAAEAGEPTFTLRAQDKTADNLVYNWACQAQAAQNGLRMPSGEVLGPSGISQAKIDDAFAIADAMRAWPNRRLPD